MEVSSSRALGGGEGWGWGAVEAGRSRSVVAGPGWRGRVGVGSCGGWQVEVSRSRALGGGEGWRWGAVEAGRWRSVVAGPGWRGRVGVGSCGGWQVEVSSSRALGGGEGSCGDWHACTCGINSCSLSDAELPTLLVFPYFMESHLSTALPSLTMSDYQVLCSLLPPPLSTLPPHTCTHTLPSHQVTYENHRHFSSSHKKPKPSPVHIFTNLPPPGLRLPPAEGYR